MSSSTNTNNVDKTRATPINTNNVNRTRTPPTNANNENNLFYVICVCRKAHDVFTLFVFVGVSLVLFYVICVCRGAPVLFTLFVFVEELLSFLCYFCW
jgi:hypothetical protein